MRSDVPAPCHRFGRYLLEPVERRLLADGVDVPLGPRAFDLLVALVENAGHLVTKEALLDAVWPRAVVEENSLQVQVSSLRKALGREAIATVSGRGYRFTLPMTAEASTASGASSVAPLHNLPQPLTSFVGREKELVQLTQAIRRTRLLTLTGAGGCGKTRLALQLANGVRSMFADGVWLVELATLANGTLLTRTLAGVLGLADSTNVPPMQAVAEHLGGRQVLLVLDNAEHLLDACARLADELLKQCARTSIMVTSRESLGVTGEATFRVPSLSVPAAKGDSTSDRVLQFESARLFVERARLQRPHFAVDDANAVTLASLCRRLDGIPLAIELAAARFRAMSLEEIDRRLDQRFALLNDGSRTALPRHRTLRSLIDWSFDLLDDAEKALLSRVSVFSDGWTLEAAESACSAQPDEQGFMLDHLSSLADKSLAIAEEQSGGTRYRLLETVRQYGLERLRESGEETVWRRRHLEYFVALGALAAPHLEGADQQSWLDRLDLEHDNLRAALAWAPSGGDVSAGLRLAVALWHFWWMRGHIGEGRDALEKLLASSTDPADATLRGRSLAAAGQFAVFQGDYVGARALQESALSVYQELGNRAAVATMLGNLGNTLEVQGEFARAWTLREEALVVHRELSPPAQIANALSNMGLTARQHGRLDQAQTFDEESLAIRREANDTWGIAASLLNLAGVALDRGALDVAARLGEESLALYRRLGERRGIAYALLELAMLACASSDTPAAKAHLAEGLAIFAELNDRGGIAQALGGLARVSMTEDPKRAARLFGGAERLRQSIGFRRTEVQQAALDRQIATARAALGDDAAFERAWQEGASMSLQEVSADALGSDAGQ